MGGQQVGRGGAPGRGRTVSCRAGTGAKRGARWSHGWRGACLLTSTLGGGAGQERGDTPPHYTKHCRCRRGSRGTELKINFKQDKTILVLN